jgi:hypothetical protein
MRVNWEFAETIQSDLARPVLLAEIFRFLSTLDHDYFTHPVQIEGRIAIVSDVGTGCGGRGQHG